MCPPPVPLLTTSPPWRTKVLCVLKKRHSKVSQTGFRTELRLGEVSGNPMDHAPILISEVLVSVMTYPGNHGGWPRVLAEDLRRHMEALKSRVVTLRGRAEGRTLLPLPLCMERSTTQDLSPEVDRALIYSIESMVIQWAGQMGAVLQRDSSHVMRGEGHPGPSAELQYWAAQKDNLLGIQTQLQNPKVEQVVEILRRIDSSYYASFRDIILRVDQAVLEAEDIEVHLRPLKKHVCVFEERSFPQLEPHMPALFHTLCLLWTHSRHYCSAKRIVTLLQQLSNLLIDKAFAYLIPEELFKLELEEATERVQCALQVLCTYRRCFLLYRDKLTPTGPYSQSACTVKPWDFPSELVFHRTDRIVERLRMMEELFASALDFLKLERIELGGSRGKILSEVVYNMNEQFHDSWRVLRESKYDPLDYTKERRGGSAAGRFSGGAVQRRGGSAAGRFSGGAVLLKSTTISLGFVRDYERFMEQNRDFDQRLGTVLNLAFQHSQGLESAFKLLQMFGSLLERPRIHQLFSPNYALLLSMFQDQMTLCQRILDKQDEMTLCQRVLDKQRERLQGGGALLSKNMPVVAGNLKWSQEIRQRILTNRSHLHHLAHM
ncbi:hypothetical protein ACEWY4_016910 [Coilia grayii]|uniref:Dynein heavy chain tail domain-containing protein n=1 Tax=Coilia grayii TaxID=363190 RepID=A0ABD1JLR1_9TELE